jgi:hypothetical protein
MMTTTHPAIAAARHKQLLDVLRSLPPEMCDPELADACKAAVPDASVGAIVAALEDYREERQHLAYLEEMDRLRELTKDDPETARRLKLRLGDWCPVVEACDTELQAEAEEHYPGRRPQERYPGA